MLNLGRVMGTHLMDMAKLRKRKVLQTMGTGE